MPSPDLAAIEARAAAATEGPWELNYTLGLSSWPIVVADGIGLIADVAEGGMSEPDAAFIAHARTDVPALIARIRELEAENAKIDDLDEALRQRDREILGLRRDRDARDAQIAELEGDAVMRDLRIVTLVKPLIEASGTFPQFYMLGGEPEDDSDLTPYMDAVRAALADLRDRYL